MPRKSISGYKTKMLEQVQQAEDRVRTAEIARIEGTKKLDLDVAMAQAHLDGLRASLTLFDATK